MSKVRVATNEQIFELLKRVDNSATTAGHVNEDDFAGAIVYDENKPETRIEAWNESGRIDLYVGKSTKMYSIAVAVAESESDITNRQDKVRQSKKKEQCVQFVSLKALEIFLTSFYSAEYKESLKKTAQQTETKKKRQNTRSKKRADAV